MTDTNARIIYRVEWQTLNGGRMGSFELPRTVGYYASERSAEQAIREHSRHQSAYDDWTDRDDYRVRQHVVHP